MSPSTSFHAFPLRLRSCGIAAASGNSASMSSDYSTSMLCPVAASMRINFLGLTLTAMNGNVLRDQDINLISDRIFTQERINILKRPFAALFTAVISRCFVLTFALISYDWSSIHFHDSLNRLAVTFFEPTRGRNRDRTPLYRSITAGVGIQYLHPTPNHASPNTPAKKSESLHSWCFNQCRFLHFANSLRSNTVERRPFN
ncbi:hypothetical protein B0H13DRAFT_1910305 [Mycena leptocephala]|nr:hypothetical protein B0H13DRAFT_1910305 [Mycena leptocephala]